MAPIGVVPGAASLHLADGLSLLHPEEQVFSAMPVGFANQQCTEPGVLDRRGPGAHGAGVRRLRKRVPVAVVACDG
jgi:hypothetical protein